MTFEDLLLDGHPRGAPVPKFELIITFLAMLEMCKLKLLRVHQTDPLAPIHLELTGQGVASAEDADPFAAEPARAAPRGDAPPAAEAGAGDAEPEALEALAEEPDAEELLDADAGPDVDMDGEVLDGDG